MNILDQARQVIQPYRMRHLRIAALKATPDQLDELADCMYPSLRPARGMDPWAWRDRVRKDAAKGQIYLFGILVRLA